MPLIYAMVKQEGADAVLGELPAPGSGGRPPPTGRFGRVAGPAPARPCAASFPPRRSAASARCRSWRNAPSLALAVDYTAYSGNFIQIALKCSAQLPKVERHTFTVDRHCFNYERGGPYIFCVVADQDYGRSVPFACLQRVKEDFIGRYGTSGTNLDRVQEFQGRLRCGDGAGRATSRGGERGERLSLPHAPLARAGST